MATFIRTSENKVAFGDENFTFFIFFFQLFYTYLAAEFFSGIKSQLIRLTVFFPKKNVITGRKTFLLKSKGLWKSRRSFRNILRNLEFFIRWRIPRVLQTQLFHLAHSLIFITYTASISSLFWCARLMNYHFFLFVFRIMNYEHFDISYLFKIFLLKVVEV